MANRMYLSGVDADSDVVGVKANSLEEGDNCGKQFSLCSNAWDTNDVHVPLVVFPLSSTSSLLKSNTQNKYNNKIINDNKYKLNN